MKLHNLENEKLQFENYDRANIFKYISDIDQLLCPNIDNISALRKKNIKPFIFSRLDAIRIYVETFKQHLGEFFPLMLKLFSILLKPTNFPDVRNEAFNLLLTSIKVGYTKIQTAECDKNWNECFDSLFYPVSDYLNIKGNNGMKEYNYELLFRQLKVMTDEFLGKGVEQDFYYFYWNLFVSYFFPKLRKYPKDASDEFKQILFHSLIALVKKNYNESPNHGISSSKDVNIFISSIDLINSVSNIPSEVKNIVKFYKYMFPCMIIYNQNENTINKPTSFIRSKITELYNKNNDFRIKYPYYLSYFNAAPSTSISKIISTISQNKNCNSTQLMISVIEPGLNIILELMNQIKNNIDKKELINILTITFGHLLRLRIITGEIYKYDALVQKYLVCTLLTQNNNLIFCSISFFFTIIYDFRKVTKDELENFCDNIFKITMSVFKDYDQYFLKYISVLAGQIAISMGDKLLELSKEESGFTKNPVLFLNECSAEYKTIFPFHHFFYDRNGLNWSVNDAKVFIFEMMEICDEYFGYIFSSSVANALFLIIKKTKTAKKEVLFGEILPILLNSLYCKKCELSYVFPITSKIVNEANRLGYMNMDLAKDWFAVLQKYLIIDVGKLSSTILNASINSILTGIPYSLGLIPFISFQIIEYQYVNFSSLRSIYSYCSTVYMMYKYINFSNFPKTIIAKDYIPEKYLSKIKLFLEEKDISNQILQSLEIIINKSESYKKGYIILLLYLFELHTHKTDNYMYFKLRDLLKSDISFPRSFLLLIKLLPQFYPLIQEKNNELFHIITRNMNNLYLGKEREQNDLCVKLLVDIMLATKKGDLYTSCFSLLLTFISEKELFHYSCDFFLTHYYRYNTRHNLELTPPYFIHNSSKYMISKGIQENTIALSTIYSTFQINPIYTENNNTCEMDEDENTNLQTFMSKIPSSLLLLNLFEKNYQNFDIENSNDSVINFKSVVLCDSYVVSVIYVGFNQTDKNEILSNNFYNISNAFYMFLKSIGKFLDISNLSFTGIPQQYLSGQKGLFWENDRNKIYYQVGPLLNEDTADSVMKRWDYIRANHVLVVWNENSYEFSYENFEDDKIKLIIVLHPINESFIRISMNAKVFNFGLFHENLIMPNNFVGLFIQLVIINLEDTINSEVQNK